MQNKLVKTFAAICCAAFVTAAYATCWTQSTNNCAWAGETHSYTFVCNLGNGTFTVARDATVDADASVTDYAVTPSTPGSNYWDSRTSVGCWATWDFTGCTGSPAQQFMPLTTYLTPSGNQTCTYP